jgi:DNA polymerase I
VIDWSIALKIEHEVARIINQQEINGVGFDKPKAEKYVEQIENECQELYDHVRPLLTKEVEMWGSVPVNRPFRADRSYSQAVHNWYPDTIPDIEGPFTRVEFKEPELGSRQKLTKQLLKLGWVPQEFTPKGAPKITEESLGFLEGVGKHIAKWYILKHRQSQIQGWLEKLRPDGRLTAGAITCGTNTGRMRHTVVVNVPKAKDFIVFGKEMRSLFIAEPPYLLVGHDAEQLELRILAHYMGDDEYIRQILEGDIHSFNQEMAGLSNRDQAKTFIYALIYGAGDYKIGTIVGGNSKDGKELKKRFFSRIPKLRALYERVSKASKKGYLIGLDGRKLWLRSEHKALNTLLQGGGAVVMKTSMIYLDRWVRNRRLDARKVIDMHDEAQAEVHPDCIDRYRELAERSIVKAGEYFNLRIPMSASSAVGSNWSQTH